jgi:hypothetical protein
VRNVLRDRRESFWYRTSSGSAAQRVWAYVDRHSVAAGDDFRIMCSVGPGPARTSYRGRIEIHRVGHHPEGNRRLVWSSAEIEVVAHSVDATAAAVGASWPPSLEVTAGDHWTSGYYSIDFVADGATRDADIASIVVTEPTHRADVLVKLAAATYQAYNRWGGHNLYPWETPSTIAGGPLGRFETDIPSNRGVMVSFDRPTRSEFFDWEYWYVTWLERVAAEIGLSVAYATNHDLATDPGYTLNPRLLVVPGHDEYWSKEEFERAHQRIFERGGNTLFLGANLAYWQVRYADVDSVGGGRGRQLVCHKSIEDPIRYRVPDPAVHVTARFRDGARLPETMLLGVGYQSNLAHRRLERADLVYRVVSTELPFLRGTGYEPGDEIGALIGHEWDSIDPEAHFAPPGETLVPGATRLWAPERSLIPALDEDSLHLVCSGSVEDSIGRQGEAHAVYFTSPAGARVFSAGTLRWSWGLGRAGYRDTDGRFDRLNRALLDHLLT